MKVHVVCYRPDADQVIARKARYLADGTGWTIGEGPRGDADVNLFHNYIHYSQRYLGWRETPTAAYFSHKDLNNETKSGWWDAAAERVDLRLTSAELYAARLRERGPTAVVRPPIERGRYAIAPGARNERPVVGLSGVVYRDGRKGEDLVARLAGSRTGRRAEWRASGRGWPVPTRWLAWGELPAFYQSLDIFLCASRVEGVPMPPLEALACGVPVVVPRGVGLLDELPGAHGVYRFDAGDYDSLEEALSWALSTARYADREALRALTEPYTPQNWRADHEAALRALAGEAPRPGAGRAVRYYAVPGEPEPPRGEWRGRAGMYCVAFGAPSRRCAGTCVRSFKAQMPGVPVAFAGTEPLGAGEDVFVRREDIDIGGRTAKLAVYDAAPREWEYVLYLDADAEVVGDVSFLFRLLADGWEAVICKDMAKYHVTRMMERPDNRAEFEETMEAIGGGELLQFNGGVFAFRRCERVARFFERWNEEWQKYAARDQGALLRALYAAPLRLFVLPNLWNASDRYPLPEPQDGIAVLHHNMAARRWEGLIWGRTDTREAWRAVERWEKKMGAGSRE